MYAKMQQKTQKTSYIKKNLIHIIMYFKIPPTFFA
jgi:hypothetical protein